MKPFKVGERVKHRVHGYKGTITQLGKDHAQVQWDDNNIYSYAPLLENLIRLVPKKKKTPKEKWADKYSNVETYLPKKPEPTITQAYTSHSTGYLKVDPESSFKHEVKPQVPDEIWVRMKCQDGKINLYAFSHPGDAGYLDSALFPSTVFIDCGKYIRAEGKK